MKILMINPNSSLEMTRFIADTAKVYAKNRISIDCICVENAPAFISSYADQVKTGALMLDIIKTSEKDYDGFIIACHLDPSLDALKECTSKPVIGIGEASMHMAVLMGRCFSIIGSSSKTSLIKRRLVEKYALEKFLVSIRTPDGESSQSQEEKLIEAAKKAVDIDHAEIVVLGCAGFSGIDKKIEAVVNVPVLDGVVCAIIQMEGILQYSSMKQS